MKLSDQIFFITPPSEWHKNLSISFPDAWHLVAGKLQTSDIQTLTWSNDYLIVSTYVASRKKDKFEQVNPETPPNVLSVVCSKHIDWNTIIPAGDQCILARHCGCCATIFYRKNRNENL
jgi:hypothetical protein